MSDEFLNRLREEPRSEFADELGRRLREVSFDGERRPLAVLRPALAGAAGLAAIAALSLLPPVRAAAREFLDLFRIQRVAAVPVDVERFARLREGGVDLKALVGPQIEVIEPAAAPVPADGREQAGALAGFTVLAPAQLPRRAVAAGVEVGRPGAFRIRFDVERLRSLADALGAADVAIPDAWQGAVLEVHAPPVVLQRYTRGEAEFVLMQSLGPEVGLPDGIELAALGKVALQLAGLGEHEASLFARSIDWRSTLLLPIPAQSGSFREVDVRGRKGVLVTSREPEREEDGSARPGRWRSALLWADDERVYALAGPGHGAEILEMAQSIG